MVKRLLKFSLFGVLALTSLAAWLRHDEAPSDYSELKIELGVNDPGINGYILMREFAETYEVVGMEDGELAQQNEIEVWDTLPDSLSALVPKYIEAIPRDPFDGEPMRYSKEHGIVYSVGNDFVDNGGSEHPFLFSYAWDDDYDEVAEQDATEPTIALRLLP